MHALNLASRAPSRPRRPSPSGQEQEPAEEPVEEPTPEPVLAEEPMPEPPPAPLPPPPSMITASYVENDEEWNKLAEKIRAKTSIKLAGQVLEPNGFVHTVQLSDGAVSLDVLPRESDDWKSILPDGYKLVAVTAFVGPRSKSYNAVQLRLLKIWSDSIRFLNTRKRCMMAF